MVGLGKGTELCYRMNEKQMEVNAKSNVRVNMCVCERECRISSYLGNTGLLHSKQKGRL